MTRRTNNEWPSYLYVNPISKRDNLLTNNTLVQKMSSETKQKIRTYLTLKPIFIEKAVK